MLKFYNVEVVLQEVPDEISLCFNITGCPLRCEGCHSPFLLKRENGKDLTDEIFIKYLKMYKNMISCVIFMGGDWEQEDLITKLKIAKKNNLKTCLYTGEEDVNFNIKENLTFLKTGAWIQVLGGLDSLITNQKFIDVFSGELLNYKFIKK